MILLSSRLSGYQISTIYYNPYWGYPPNHWQRHPAPLLGGLVAASLALALREQPYAPPKGSQSLWNPHFRTSWCLVQQGMADCYGIKSQWFFDSRPRGKLL